MSGRRPNCVPISALHERFVIVDGRIQWRRRHTGRNTGEVGWLSNGYRRVSVNGQKLPVHRIVWAMVHGKWPASELDHHNRRRADNRVTNLREITHSQNLLNTGLYRSNTSGFKGVYWSKAAGKWTACIRINSKLKHLGCFESREAAHAAYCAAHAAACAQPQLTRLNCRKVA